MLVALRSLCANLQKTIYNTDKIYSGFFMCVNTFHTIARLPCVLHICPRGSIEGPKEAGFTAKNHHTTTQITVLAHLPHIKIVGYLDYNQNNVKIKHNNIDKKLTAKYTF
jgi:hypothetical protein